MSVEMCENINTCTYLSLYFVYIYENTNIFMHMGINMVSREILPQLTWTSEVVFHF